MSAILENAIKVNLKPGQLAWVRRAIVRKKHHTNEPRVTISSYFQALIEREQRARELSQEVAAKIASNADDFHAFQPPRPLP